MAVNNMVVKLLLPDSNEFIHRDLSTQGDLHKTLADLQDNGYLHLKEASLNPLDPGARLAHNRDLPV